MPTNPSIAIFRQLIRTIRTTFCDDPPAISAARRELKNAFTVNRNLTDRSEINAALVEAVEARDFIRYNVIQAVKKDCGSFDITSPEKAAQLRGVNPEDTRHG